MAESHFTEPEGDVDDADNLNPEQLGFMCGIEVHQQLATGKLHSRQPGNLYDITADTVPKEWPRFSRKLRAARGEGGKIDIAARFEIRRNRSFEYVQSPNSGLIELDEQPPLLHDEEALDIALTTAALLEAKPVSLLQTMRKTVVDGSNTSGFQRTTLISTGGVLKTQSSDVGISVLCLEEDSARKLESYSTKDGECVIYNLDRLGLPLIEIATEPDVKNPDHAKETSIALGRTLRQTRRVRRGLGSIRQDLNVSIACGDRIEIKGCQDLNWIPRIIRLEMARQLHFYRLSNKLRTLHSLPVLPPDRRLDDEQVESAIKAKVAGNLPLKLVEVGELFSDCESKMVSEGIQNNSSMIALPLAGLSGLIGSKQHDAEGAQLPRLGRELAGAAKLAGVKGVFHSDELPAYGIEQKHVDMVRKQLSLSEGDAFVLCLAPKWQAELALESVLLRARAAWHRISQEVRNVVIKKGSPEDGTTSPMRPLPGRSRMYPETDIPPMQIKSQTWSEVIDNLPMTDVERKDRMSNYDISTDQMEQILARELDDSFVQNIAKLPAKAWATVLLENDDVDPKLSSLILFAKEEEKITREAINDVILHFKGTLPTLEDISTYAQENDLKPADASSLQSIIDDVISERLDFVKERGMGAIGPLMGVVMQKAGAADGKAVSALLKQAIQKATK